jgi:NAD(P)H-flavin reductase
MAGLELDSRAKNRTTANPWLPHAARVERITEESPGINTYHLRFIDPVVNSGFRFRPGQFNMLYLPGAGEIAISLSGGSQGGGTWDHTVRDAGSVTRTLARLGRGGSLGVRGPFGSSWPLAVALGADLILVAGGIGLSPLRPAIYELFRKREQFGQATLLYGARSPDSLLYVREYPMWTENKLNVYSTVDRSAADWQGNVGVVSLLLDRLRALRPANTMLLCCGPEVMMRYSVRSALARGIRKDQIWLSLERNMQCAVGLCGHCQLGPAFICKDGPVFRYDVIEPFLELEGL